MESVNSRTENQTSESPEKNTKNRKHYDRITLDEKTIDVLEGLLQQAQEQLSAMPAISLKDLVNFLVEVRGQELTAEELGKLYSQNFDQIKIMKLATQDMVAAKARGESLSMQDALKKYETPSIGKNVLPKKTKGRPKKVNGDPASTDVLSAEIGSFTSLESTKSKALITSKKDSKNEDFSSENTKQIVLENA